LRINIEDGSIIIEPKIISIFIKMKIMKKIQKIILSTLTILLGSVLILSSCQDKETATPDGYKTTDPNTSVSSLTNDSLNCDCLINPADTIYDNEIAMLQFMREEEKLARDVYITLYNQYQINIFNNISNSEQRHMDRILCLLLHYNIEDPAQDAVGVFTNTDLQDLYNALIAQGSISLIDAYTVGATIEDVDIFDLEENMNETSNEAILTIFSHLKCGSENHMRAFSRKLSTEGATYTPQYISQEEYNAILDANSGPCGEGNGSGNGNGNGGNCDGSGNGGDGNGGGNGNGNGNGGGNGNGNGGGGNGGGDCDGSGGNG